MLRWPDRHACRGRRWPFLECRCGECGARAIRSYTKVLGNAADGTRPESETSSQNGVLLAHESPATSPIRLIAALGAGRLRFTGRSRGAQRRLTVSAARMMSAPIWLSNDFHTGCIFVRQAWRTKMQPVWKSFESQIGADIMRAALTVNRR